MFKFNSFQIKTKMMCNLKVIKIINVNVIHIKVWFGHVSIRGLPHIWHVQLVVPRNNPFKIPNSCYLLSSTKRHNTKAVQSQTIVFSLYI